MVIASKGVPLVGREAELRLLGRLVEGVRDAGGAVVVRGEAGIGKSALLAEAARMAAVGGLRVLRAAGVEAEAQVAIAELRQLLRPVVGQVEELPGPQRDAVSAAFGGTTVAAPDPFLIALGTLNLVAEAAARVPVLLVMEDVQWLDRASVDVLAFVARRLEFEPVVLLAAVRDGFPVPSMARGCPSCVWGGWPGLRRLSCSMRTLPDYDRRFGNGFWSRRRGTRSSWWSCRSCSGRAKAGTSPHRRRGCR